MAEWQKDGYTVSDERARLDVGVIHEFLDGSSYWARGRSRERVRRSLAHSLPFGLYRDADGRQVGFARVVTDYTTFAWLADVFVLDSERGRGLGKWLVACVVAHPELAEVRRWLLATRDAQELYSRFGFRDLKESPLGWMEKLDPDLI